MIIPMYNSLEVGVLALQGDFERHLYRLASLSAKGRAVRRSENLRGLDALIIPGGESTTMSILIDRFDLRSALVDFCLRRAVWGTCAGMIMAAREVDDVRIKPLGIIDISVVRNGYGRQVHSFYTELEAGLNGSRTILQASFIRAPVVTAWGPSVEILSIYKNIPVLLAENNCLVSSFHVELHDDLSLTKFFLDRFAIGSAQKAVS
jgi:5'-phosphate synthase pdxT subunit